MTRLVLVNQWTSGVGYYLPPLGLGYLSSYLKKYLHFDDIAIVNTGKNTFRKIIEHQPKIVGFSVNSAGYSDTLNLMKQVKKKIRSIIVAGGPHITTLPDRMPKEVDIGLIGESEQSMLELMQLYLKKEMLLPSDLRNLNGIAYWNKSQLYRTKPRSFITPLDRIPMPDRELLEIDRFLKPSQILMNNQYLCGAEMRTSRGCPFHCIYCQASAIWGMPRLHSYNYVVNEIDILVKKYGVKGIYISDDIFFHDLKRIKDIIKLMKQKNLLGKVRFLVHLRVNTINDNLIKILKKMGVAMVALGLESGSDRILQYLKGNNVTVDMNLEVVKKLNIHGIGCYSCFMIGSPPETLKDIQQTKNLIQNILNMDTINYCQVTVTTPLPGTLLWNYAIKKGTVSNDPNWSHFSMSPIVYHRKDFYINEHIDFEQFSNIALDLFSICYKKQLSSHISNFSFQNIKKFFLHPHLTLKLFKALLKYH